MFAINVEQTFSKEDLFYCYSPNLKKYLCKTKNISYIGRGMNSESNKTYWLFIKTQELSDSLLEWANNANNGIKAVKMI
jgi:hypothetical protein